MGRLWHILQATFAPRPASEMSYRRKAIPMPLLLIQNSAQGEPSQTFNYAQHHCVYSMNVTIKVLIVGCRCFLDTTCAVRGSTVGNSLNTAASFKNILEFTQVTSRSSAHTVRKGPHRKALSIDTSGLLIRKLPPIDLFLSLLLWPVFL